MRNVAIIRTHSVMRVKIAGVLSPTRAHFINDSLRASSIYSNRLIADKAATGPTIIEGRPFNPKAKALRPKYESEIIIINV
jgi:hypothetical protein